MMHARYSILKLYTKYTTVYCILNTGYQVLYVKLPHRNGSSARCMMSTCTLSTVCGVLYIDYCIEVLYITYMYCILSIVF